MREARVKERAASHRMPGPRARLALRGFVLLAWQALAAADASAQSVTRTQNVMSPDGFAGQEFGSAVAIEGSIAVVTAPLDDEKGFETGAAYVYENDGAAWTLTAKLTASDASPQDRFGHDVSIDGGTIVIGPQHPAGLATGIESVYVYDKVGGAWTETAVLSDPTLTRTDLFGRNVILVGDTLVVSAERGAWSDRGTLCVFERHDGTWTKTQRLDAPFSAAIPIARDVAFDGETIVAYGAYSSATSSSIGSIHVWHRDCGAFNYVQWMPSPVDLPQVRFGTAVAVDGEWMAVASSPGDGLDPPARVDLLHRLDGTWTIVQTLVSGTANPFDYYARELKMKHGMLLVGASGLKVGTQVVGGAFLYAQCEDWPQRAVLLGDPAAGARNCGYSVAIDWGGIVLGDFSQTVLAEFRGGAQFFAHDINRLAPGREVSSDDASEPLLVREDGAAVVVSHEDLGDDVTSYNLYRGDIGSWYSHAGLACTTVPPLAGARRESLFVDSAPASYYLVTTTALCEGLSGHDSCGRRHPMAPLDCPQ